MQQRLTLPRSARLKLDRDFARVLSVSRRAEDRYLLVYVDENQQELTRMGIRAHRRVGNAVQRNRIRRLIREAFRLGRHELPAGIDIVCIAKARPNSTNRRSPAPRLADYRESLMRLVPRARARPHHGAPGRARES
ncbi:MAG TPA: ribonuclease P protein component [Phycisphaerae bacterium]